MNLLILHCDGITRVWMKPSLEKDQPEKFFKYLRNTNNLEKLVNLGLLMYDTQDEDINQTIKEAKEQEGREAVAMAVTVQGMLMFGNIVATDKWIN